MTMWYDACTHCTARWWSPERFRLCPQCGHLAPAAFPVARQQSLELVLFIWARLRPHVREAMLTLISSCAAADREHEE
jgi:hypothetical protein